MGRSAVSTACRVAATALAGTMACVSAGGSTGFDFDAHSREVVQSRPDHTPSSDLAALALQMRGQATFFARWAPKGNPGDTVGLGPLFNARSCSDCHERGGGAQGPSADGAVPVALVIHLESQGRTGETRGDPVYGQVLSTFAVDSARPEGLVRVTYSEKPGYYYPFGPRWNLRVPHYSIEDLAFGPLAASTVIKPRLAPALFGVGVLEQMVIPDAAADSTQHERASGHEAIIGQRAAGHLGWHGDVATIREQTAIALATDMGITSPVQVADDCTPSEVGCWRPPLIGAAPDTSMDVLDALVQFQRSLPAPVPIALGQQEMDGGRLFKRIGCTACHSDHPVSTLLPDASSSADVIPYTDLRLHDLGASMSDETVSGVVVATSWRTAPLWGIAQRLHDHPARATFLHDGRARSTEEAILWHGGEAARITRTFMKLGPRQRESLLRWLDAR